MRSVGALVAGFLAGCLLVVIALAMFVTINQQQAQCGTQQVISAAGSADAASQIPPELMPFYRSAAARYRLGPSGWAWLAAINAQETDFGRNLQTSTAGAEGWMQFMPQTWAVYGVDAHGDGRKDPNDPADAIYAAANYLHTLGAPSVWHHAVFTYGGNAEWYFAQVAQRAQTFLADPAAIASATPTGVASLLGPALAMAAGSQTVGLTLTGYTSVFNDHSTASGIPADGSWPGIAVLDAATLGGYWKVTYPNGRTLVLQQIDVGPAPGLGPAPEHRVVDTDYAAATAAGYAPTGFPTDRGMVSATYLGKDARFGQLNGQVVRASLPAGQEGAGCMPEAPAAGVSGNVTAAADALAAMHIAYNYGGGHVTPARPTGGQDGPFAGLDCSSSVSWVLQHAGLRLPTMTSGEFMTWGDPGPGSTVSIYANPGHVFMKSAAATSAPAASDTPTPAPDQHGSPSTHPARISLRPSSVTCPASNRECDEVHRGAAAHSIPWDEVVACEGVSLPRGEPVKPSVLTPWHGGAPDGASSPESGSQRQAFDPRESSNRARWRRVPSSKEKRVALPDAWRCGRLTLLLGAKLLL